MDFPVSWEELHRHAKVLAHRVMHGTSWTGIVAITRGGLVPAAIVARELEIRVVETVSVATYDDRTRGAARILKPPQAAIGDGAGWLIVDDLVDTGATARVVRDALPAAHFATVYAKPEGRPLVDTFVTEVSQDTWILFPWVTEPRAVDPLARRRGA
jgi:xanthine phosphoribosyltransferase